MNGSKSILCWSLLCLFVTATVSKSQESRIIRDKYIVSDERKLEIVVHIWGQVYRPGQYIVPDGTNVLELISLAGGPTDYSNLRSIKLTREKSFSPGVSPDEDRLQHNEFVRKELIEIDMKKYLESEASQSIPILLPGDVVKISTNFSSRWQTFIRVLSQVAIVIQAVYFYSQIE